MEYTIQLQKTREGEWVVCVRLPVKWLAQFERHPVVYFMGETLCLAWGNPYLEAEQEQPWRVRNVNFTAESLARQNVTYLEKMLASIVAGLVEPRIETFRGSLDVPAQEPILPLPSTREEEREEWERDRARK